jgi:hypothetical protein
LAVTSCRRCCCVRRPGIEPGVSRVSGERRDRLARGGCGCGGARQSRRVDAPGAAPGASGVSDRCSAGELRVAAGWSGTDQSRTDHLRGFRPALFQLSYGPIESGRRESNPLILGGSQACDHQHFARRPTTWSGRPGSNRHQRVGNAPLWPLSYIHVDAETGFAPVRDSCPTALQAAAFGYSATRRQLRGWGSNPRRLG